MFAHKMVLLHRSKLKVNLLMLVKMKIEIRMKVCQFTELFVKITQICAKIRRKPERANIVLKKTSKKELWARENTQNYPNVRNLKQLTRFHWIK